MTPPCPFVVFILNKCPHFLTPSLPLVEDVVYGWPTNKDSLFLIVPSQYFQNIMHKNKLTPYIGQEVCKNCRIIQDYKLLSCKRMYNFYFIHCHLAFWCHTLYDCWGRNCMAWRSNFTSCNGQVTDLIVGLAPFIEVFHGIYASSVKDKYFCDPQGKWESSNT